MISGNEKVEHTLDSVEWGKPALSLLSKCRKLDIKLPAVMHIRHTERPRLSTEDLSDSRKLGRSTLLSTRKGKKAAFEFGERLPDNRTYRVYHSPIDRAKETAEMINEGILSQGVESRLKGVFMRVNHDTASQYSYIQRDIIDAGAPNSRPYFINYVSEHYPPWEMEPGSLIAKRHAAIMVENLKMATSDNFDIYVSHDTYIATFLLYWFGIMPDERYIQFLDGFIAQFNEEHSIVWTKDGRKKAYYPYWWDF